MLKQAASLLMNTSILLVSFEKLCSANLTFGVQVLHEKSSRVFFNKIILLNSLFLSPVADHFENMKDLEDETIRMQTEAASYRARMTQE